MKYVCYVLVEIDSWFRATGIMNTLDHAIKAKQLLEKEGYIVKIEKE